MGINIGLHIATLELNATAAVVAPMAARVYLTRDEEEGPSTDQGMLSGIPTKSIKTNVRITIKWGPILGNYRIIKHHKYKWWSYTHKSRGK